MSGKAFLVAALAPFAFAGMACTAITLAQWNGYTQGGDGGSGADGTSGGPESGCNAGYLSGISACGSCMEQNCASYISLVCQIDAGSPYATGWVDENLVPCAQDTNVPDDNCGFITAPDASISTGGDPAALESNVNVCLKANCSNACRSCTVTYSGCGGTSVTVGPDSPCGACITDAMKGCQTELANCCFDLASDPNIGACSRTTKSCNGAGNCSAIFSGDAGSFSSDPCVATAYQCITQKCGPGGSNLCQ